MVDDSHIICKIHVENFGVNLGQDLRHVKRWRRILAYLVDFCVWRKSTPFLETHLRQKMTLVDTYAKIYAKYRFTPNDETASRLVGTVITDQ